MTRSKYKILLEGQKVLASDIRSYQGKLDEHTKSTHDRLSAIESNLELLSEIINRVEMYEAVVKNLREQFLGLAEKIDDLENRVGRIT